MKTPDDYTDEERAAIEAFKKLDPCKRTLVIISAILVELGTGRVDNDNGRHDVVNAALALYRTEIVGDFAEFILKSGEKPRNMLIGAAHECTRRKQDARNKFIETVEKHMSGFGETLQ